MGIRKGSVIRDANGKEWFITLEQDNAPEYDSVTFKTLEGNAINFNVHELKEALKDY